MVNLEMPVLIRVLMVLILTGFLFIKSFGQTFPPDLFAYEVTIMEGSQVLIKGKTNVNQFHCLNCQHIKKYSQHVNLQQAAGDELKSDNAFLILETSEFDCGMNQMTRDFKTLLETESHPEMIIRLKEFSLLNDSISAELDVTLSGVCQSVDLIASVRRNDDNIYHFQGISHVNITDFNLKPPTKFFGVVKVKELIGVEFDLILKVETMAQD